MTVRTTTRALLTDSGTSTPARASAQVMRRPTEAPSVAAPVTGPTPLLGLSDEDLDCCVSGFGFVKAYFSFAEIVAEYLEYAVVVHKELFIC